MKKILLGAAAALAIMGSSCSKSDNAAANSNDAFNDSISTAFGLYVGASLNQQSQDLTPEQRTEFLTAFQSTMALAKNEAQMRGALVAIQMLQSAEQLKQTGIELDRTTMIDGFKKAYTLDSISFETLSMLQTDFMNLRQSGMEKARLARIAEAEQAPEAQENVRLATEFINKAKAEDSAIETSTSGLSYKIEEPGTGDKPTENSTVKVQYVGKHLNGEVFDQTNGEPATFNLRGVVAGFREGLMLLGKGGKATLYIPGQLAYGVDGAPQANIGPNEMLIFEVTLDEIQ